jgi:hypothetical protein
MSVKKIMICYIVAYVALLVGGSYAIGHLLEDSKKECAASHGQLTTVLGIPLVCTHN